MSARNATDSAEVWRGAVRSRPTSRSPGVERGVEGVVAVTNIFKAMVGGTPRQQEQDQVFATERLNRGFLVHVEYDRVLRWMQIQATHIGCLGFKVLVVRGRISFMPMRLKGVLGPDTRHRYVRDVPQLCRQLVRGLVRRFVTRCVFRCLGLKAYLDPFRHFVAHHPGVGGEQPCHSIHDKALAPMLDVTVIAVQLGANRALRQASSRIRRVCRAEPVRPLLTLAWR